ncbi:MAG: peptidoglycan-binding protein [Bifidobacteriaceae bacterium]|jgi:hypothetical protein|nr:peptidoglycan-binding protein [Bifidobacteriaceae bacterium]
MKKLLALLATIGLGAAGLIATTSQPADAANAAAVANCTTTNTQVWGSYRAYIPSSGGAAGRNCYLGVGIANVAVKNLQQQMNYCNVKSNPINADGDFGDATYHRLRVVQILSGLKGNDIDGKYGLKTHNAMKFYWSYTDEYGQLRETCVKDWAI